MKIRCILEFESENDVHKILDATRDNIKNAIRELDAKSVKFEVVRLNDSSPDKV